MNRRVAVAFLSAFLVAPLPFRAAAGEPVPLVALQAPNTLLRSGLTDVELNDGSAPAKTEPVFGDLYKEVEHEAPVLTLRQKLGGGLVLEQHERVGIEREREAMVPGKEPIQNAAGESVLAAKWNPAERLTLKFSETSDTSLNAEGNSPDTLLREVKALAAEWKAGGDAALSVNELSERDWDWGSSTFDTKRTTSIGLAQKFGKTGFSWSANPAWVEEVPGQEGAGFQSFAASGPQLGGALEWKPQDGGTWQLGGLMNQFEEVDAAASTATRRLFLAYDRSMAHGFRFLFRTDYETVDSRNGAAAASEEDRFRLRLGESMTLPDDFSAQIDVSRSLQQQDRQSWTNADSLATLSVRKQF